MDAEGTNSPDRGDAEQAGFLDSGYGYGTRRPAESASVPGDRAPVGPEPSPPNIDHLARLAALRLDGEERLGVERDLRRIIALVDEMQAVDTEGVAPLAHPLDATQRLRADEATERVDRERCQAGAPDACDGFYLVPSVLSD